MQTRPRDLDSAIHSLPRTEARKVIANGVAELRLINAQRDLDAIARTAERKTMAQDLAAQREAITEALSQLSGKCDRLAAMATLRGVLAYREQQRKQRKATT